jgi:hypothetical protein|tara:strand:- start:4012 stop:4242 length:231 start_codon:yes stop_codon:yes gene_type:complete
MQRDLNFYLKWAGTVILIIGTAINSMGYYPAGPLVLLLGGIFWVTISIRWREASLIVTNGVMMVTTILGLAWHYLR